jgi:hypothetical protein
MQAHFIVYDLTTGEIKRHGNCPPELLPAQARPHKNEGVRLDQRRTADEVRELFVTHRMVLPANASPYLRRRAAAEIAERTARLRRPQVTPEMVLRRVLKVKGIDITDNELKAAQRAVLLENEAGLSPSSPG